MDRYEGSFIVFLRVTLWFSLLAVFDATDVYLNCPGDQWVIGNPVTIFCSALKTAYPSQCTSISREVEFGRSPNGASYTARCSLDDVENTCTSSSSDCACSNSNSTHFNFQYTFSVAADSSGYWECNVPCLNGITPQLTYSSSAGCKDRPVTAGPCDGMICGNGGTCYVENNEAKCNCNNTYYSGDTCEGNGCTNFYGSAKCTILQTDPKTPHYFCSSWSEGADCEDFTESAQATIVLGVIAGTCVLGAFAYLAYQCFTTQKLCRFCNSHPGPTRPCELRNLIHLRRPCRLCRCFNSAPPSPHEPPYPIGQGDCKWCKSHCGLTRPCELFDPIPKKYCRRCTCYDVHPPSGAPKVEPKADYDVGTPMSQANYTGKGNGSGR